MADGYVALVHMPKGKSGWGVTFPDVSGCTSSGATFEEAVAGAREALSGHLAALRDDGDPIPQASTLNQLREADPGFMRPGGEVCIMFVQPVGVPGERVRLNIMMDKGLLQVVDEAAKGRAITRSRLIEEALVEYVGFSFNTGQ